MEAKPFSLQSPEKVAEAYGGNKQKIAQAIQMGALDPTSGLLAGMFIDRMRSAQAMEQAPQQTVAQKVFAPPAPPPAPAGLGAIAPQGGGMPAPQGPQMASAAPMGMPAPMGQPPVGMAAGGMTELPDSYGLESLPIPDNMYNEESFAGGGIVAFRTGDAVDVKAQERKVLMTIATMGKTFAERSDAMQKLRAMDTAVDTTPLAPASELIQNRSGLLDIMQGGNPDSELPLTLQKNLASRAYNTSFTPPPEPGMVAPDAIPAAVVPAPAVAPAVAPAPRAAGTATGRRGAPRATRTPAGATAPAAGTTPEMSDEDIAEKRMQGFLAAAKPPAPKGTTDEEKAARKNEDLWSALAQIGFGMAAGESPNFLTNVGKATAAAVPGMQESLKERRADTKEELKQKYAYELAQAGLSSEAYKLKLSQFDRLEDNRYRKETLDEQKRSNRRREELQEQQIARSGVTGEGTMLAQYLAAPEGSTIRKGMEDFFKARTGFGEGKLSVAQQTAITRAHENIDNKYKDQLFRLSVTKKKAPELTALQNKITQEKRAAELRITGDSGIEPPLGFVEQN